MQFVVLHHTGWPGRADHYDLMLQFAAGKSDDDRVLSTFATIEDTFPSGQPPTKLQRIEDHRRAYLTLEGKLSGNRGVISRIDSGALFYIGQASNEVTEFELRGTKLTGRFRITRLKAIYSFEKIDTQ